MQTFSGLGCFEFVGLFICFEETLGWTDGSADENASPFNSTNPSLSPRAHVKEERQVLAALAGLKLLTVLQS